MGKIWYGQEPNDTYTIFVLQDKFPISNFSFTQSDSEDDFSKPLFGRPEKSSKVKDSSESGEDKSGSGSGNNSR